MMRKVYKVHRLCRSSERPLASPPGALFSCLEVSCPGHIIRVKTNVVSLASWVLLGDSHCPCSWPTLRPKTRGPAPLNV